MDGPELLISDKQWRSSTAELVPEGWQRTRFDDTKWAAVQSIGGIESSIELFQWNADAGLYDWPGYDGISGFLAHTPIPASGILAQYAGRGNFTYLESLTGGAGEFGVRLPAVRQTDEEAPSVVLDFGRELTGRLELVSDSDTPVTVTVQMGESESEAMKAPYLGVNQLDDSGAWHRARAEDRVSLCEDPVCGWRTGGAVQSDSRGRYLLPREV